MKIKIDKNFLQFAESLKIKPLALEKKLTKAIESLVFDEPECWGLSVKDSTWEDVVLSEFADALRSIEIEPTSENVDAVMEFILMGNFDCPECGGEMEVFDGDYTHEGDGYNSEYITHPIWEDIRCTHCGYWETIHY